MPVNLAGVPGSVYPVLLGQRGPQDLQEQLWLQWYQTQTAAENAALQQQQEEAARQAAADAANQAAIASAAGTNVTPATPAGPAALAPGFESSYVPSTLTDPFEQQAFTRGRTKAEDFISNLFKRGAITETGRTSGLSALAQQDPTVRARLNDIGNVLLEGEKAKLRGIGRTEADIPAVASEATSFQAGLPGAYEAALPAGDLFSVGGIPAASGAVAGEQTVPGYDPYAVAGGKLTTGLEEEAPPGESKKRTTAVF